MTRRLFIQSTALGTLAARRPDAGARPICLQAFVNAGMPASITLPAGVPRALLYELRAYARARHVEEALRAAGVSAIALDERTMLLPFPGLRQRAETWDRVNAALRVPAAGYRFALYHAS